MALKVKTSKNEELYQNQIKVKTEKNSKEMDVDLIETVQLCKQLLWDGSTDMKFCQNMSLILLVIYMYVRHT